MPLSGHSMSVVPRLRHLLVVGGESVGSQVLDFILLFDPIAAKSVTLNPQTGFAPQLTAAVSVAPNAPALARHTMTLTIDGRAIILGGTTAQGILANLTSAYVMDTQSPEAAWKQVPLLGTPPDPRIAFTTVMVNATTLLLYGGTNDFKSAYWVTFYLDLPTWTWSSPMAQGTIPRRWGHTATMVGNTMVVMFGKEHARMKKKNAHFILQERRYILFLIQGDREQERQG
ncbi:MAG: hypothetical protein J3R72DRAFT_423614 [Linnemannia gamsii]|nr:MAG: hypothetical protein J3R72DRAFT_423614 [Linnemannia gamsii]